MKQSIIIAFCIAVFSISVNAQSGNENLRSNENKLGSISRLHLLTPGVLIEKKLNSESSLIFDFTLGFSYQYEYNFNTGTSSSYSTWIPQFKLERRKYLTLMKRAKLGRRTDYFCSACFSGQIIAGYYTDPGMPFLSLGPVAGFQCTLGKKGYIDIGVGAGLSIADGIYPAALGNFGLGFILN